MLPHLPPPFSAAGLWVVFWRWNYLLALALGLTAVVSASIAWAIPDSYRSTAIFLPAALPRVVPDSAPGPQPVDDAASASLDRLLSIGQSRPLAESMVRQFHLYGYRPASLPEANVATGKALREFAANLSLIRNASEAIELTFQSHDKQLAANVANALVAAIDSASQRLTLVSRRQEATACRQRVARLRASEAATQRQLLATRRRYGIFNPGAQSRYLTQTILNTEKELRIAEAGGPGHVAGLRRALRALTRAEGGNLLNLESWTQGTDSVALLTTQLADLHARTGVAQATAEQAEAALSSRATALQVIQSATPATQPSGPFRFLIVLGSVAFMLALSVFLILLLELYRHEQNQRPA